MRRCPQPSKQQLQICSWNFSLSRSGSAAARPYLQDPPALLHALISLDKVQMHLACIGSHSNAAEGLPLNALNCSLSTHKSCRSNCL